MKLGKKTLKSRIINRILYILIIPVIIFIVLPIFIVAHIIIAFRDIVDMYVDSWDYDKAYDKMDRFNKKFNGNCTLWDYIKYGSEYV